MGAALWDGANREQSRSVTSRITAPRARCWRRHGEPPTPSFLDEERCADEAPLLVAADSTIASCRLDAFAAGQAQSKPPESLGSPPSPKIHTHRNPPHRWETCRCVGVSVCQCQGFRHGHSRNSAFQTSPRGASAPRGADADAAAFRCDSSSAGELSTGPPIHALCRSRYDGRVCRELIIHGASTMLRLPYTEIRELTVSEVAARLGQPGCFVFDNGRRRWKRRHVPGA